jgi:hypothetical protein
MEATKESVNALIENAADDIGDGLFQQKPDVIRAGLGHCAGLRPLLDRMLDRLAGFSGN